MSFAQIDGGGPGGYAAPRPPVVTDSYGHVPTPTGSQNVPGLGPVPTFEGAPIAPPQELPTSYHGEVPSGYVAPAGFTPPPVTGFTPQQAPPPKTQSIDINSLLQKALANMGYSQLDSSLQTAREQLITRFGDANLANLAGFGLDPQAGAFAQQNYLSGNADLARLDKQNAANKKGVIDRLVSHGILNSGDLGYGLNQAESQYGNSRYDLTQSYLQKLSDLLTSTLQQKQTLRSNVVNALLSAYGSQIQNPDQLIGLYGG